MHIDTRACSIRIVRLALEEIAINYNQTGTSRLETV